MKCTHIVNLMAVIPLCYNISKYPDVQSKTNSLLWHSYMFRPTYRTIIMLSLKNFCVVVYLFKTFVTSWWWSCKWNETCNLTWWPCGLRRGFVVARFLGIAGCKPAGGAWCVCLLWMLCVVQVEVSVTGRSLVQMSPTECVCACVRACVCASLSVFRCNNKPLHLRQVGSRSQTKKNM
jgi:hypothetical protein